MDKISINSEFIKLDQFLKFANLVESGSDAKFYIQTGQVSVNGEIEERRGRKLYSGDTIRFQNKTFQITVSNES